jgi:hypothetical protein
VGVWGSLAVETVLLGDMQHTVFIQTDDCRSVSGTGNQASSSPHDTTLLHVPRAAVKPCDPHGSAWTPFHQASVSELSEEIIVATDEREGARFSMTAGRVLQVWFRQQYRTNCVRGSITFGTTSMVVRHENKLRELR